MLLEELEPFKEDFVISGENAGLHLLLRGKGRSTEKELIKKAEEVGVKVYGLSGAFVSQKESGGEAAIILGYGGLSDAEIQQGIERLKKAWLS